MKPEDVARLLLQAGREIVPEHIPEDETIERVRSEMFEDGVGPVMVRFAQLARNEGLRRAQELAKEHAVIAERLFGEDYGHVIDWEDFNQAIDAEVKSTTGSVDISSH